MPEYANLKEYDSMTFYRVKRGCQALRYLWCFCALVDDDHKFLKVPFVDGIEAGLGFHEYFCMQLSNACNACKSKTDLGPTNQRHRACMT
jgi:hypothetical protein